jgi:hypothetical protein
MGNIYHHTFLDTDEGKVSRQVKGLYEKFRIHNADPFRTKRLEYLTSEFLDRKPLLSVSSTKKYGGISDTHHSIINLLLLLSTSPSCRDLDGTGLTPIGGANRELRQWMIRAEREREKWRIEEEVVRTALSQE